MSGTHGSPAGAVRVGGEYKTTEELARVINLAELLEDEERAE